MDNSPFYKDVLGKAILDYYNYAYPKKVIELQDILTWTNISDKDPLPASYFFRTFSEMPKIEQVALQNCQGKTLDVGCGAGSHSIYLQSKGYHVTAIDISKKAIEVTKKRGVKQALCKDILAVKETFDTILLLMNGTGIFQRFHLVTKYLSHLKNCLNPNGQILIDSSDISYMYTNLDKEKDLIDNSRYYGELDYFISYKNDFEYPITWLYLDFKNLKKMCAEVGLSCDMVVEGPHFDYLAKIYIQQ